MKKVMFLLCCICVVVVACGPRQREAMIYYRRGLAKDSAKDYKSARVAFEIAAMLDPALAKAYYREGLDDAYVDTARELHDLSMAIKTDPAYTEARAARALVNYSRDHYKEALIDYDSVLAKKPGDIVARLNIAVTMEQMADYKGAIAMESKVIEQAPGNEWAWKHKALSEIALHQYDSALKDANRMVTDAPYNAYWRNLRSTVKFYLRDFSGAIADEDMAMLVCGTREPLYFVNRAEAYCYQRDYKNAMDDCASALEINGKYEPAWKVLGLIAATQHKDEEALGYYNRAQQYDSSDADQYFLKAQTYRAMHDYTNAIKTLDTLRIRRPEIDSAHLITQEIKWCIESAQMAQQMQQLEAAEAAKKK